MFKDTRKAFSIGQDIALNLPVLITVVENSKGFPITVRTKDNNQFMKVLSIVDLWQIYGEWWKSNSNVINRMFYRLNVDERLITVFKNLNSGEWYFQND